MFSRSDSAPLLVLLGAQAVVLLLIFKAATDGRSGRTPRVADNDTPTDLEVPAATKVSTDGARAEGPPPVRYVLYDGDYGQMGNQRFSLVNALFLAETLNATLVVPMSRNIHWRIPEPQAMRLRHGHRLVHKDAVPHSLLGWYYDYYRSTPDLMFENEFASTQSFQKLSSMVLPMAQTDYSKNLKFVIKPESNETREDRRLCANKGGVCIPQSDCRNNDFFKQGSFGTDSLLLGRVFSPFNCTAESKRWLQINHAIRPRRLFEDSVRALFSKIKHPVLGIHIRLLDHLEKDGVAEGQGSEQFLEMMKREYSDSLEGAGSVYVAYKPDDQTELIISVLIKFCESLDKKVYTVADILAGDQSGSKFEFPYSLPMLDMTALSRVDSLIGRRRSTFSVTAMYLREAIGKADENAQVYSGAVFEAPKSTAPRNFTCPYYSHKMDLSDPSCRDN